ncbi:MAG: hypothetical protein K0R36_598 [Chryseobacterium sp.]|jgi:hypothetical protein|nr:hypothetical protein [Chryseobacterium sp.]
MKAKVIFLSAVSAVVVYSCTTERDEYIKENPTENQKIEQLEMKKLKQIKPGNTQANKTASDTIIATPPASPQSGFELDPGFEINPNPDPNEGDDPKNVPPRK